MEPFFCDLTEEYVENPEWIYFSKVIEKAQKSCKNANSPVLDHFVDTNKMVLG